MSQISQFNYLWLCYPLLGCLVGFLAGLLGIGGGLITVPIVTLIMGAFGIVHPDAHKIALATSTTAIVFTAFSSMRSHVAHRNVHWPAVKGLLPGILLGTVLGTALVHVLPIAPLKIIFIGFTFYTAYKMLYGGTPLPSRRLPERAGLFGVGGVIGGFSTLISAGGGFITVPFLIRGNVSARMAIGTSAVLGFPIALGGVLAYLIGFYNQTGLPAHTVAYIYWPAVLGIVVTSMLVAPMGAKAAQVLPVATLKKLFAGLLVGLGVHMVWTMRGMG